MDRNLIQAAETLKWPLKIIYPNIPATQRRAFERGYQDLLYLQAEYVLSYLLIPLYPSSRLRVMGNSTNKIEGRDCIQELMEIGRKEMDCIHCRLLLRGLNCGLDIISRVVGIPIGLTRFVLSSTPSSSSSSYLSCRYTTLLCTFSHLSSLSLYR
jgi:hypothetical protein